MSNPPWLRPRPIERRFPAPTSFRERIRGAVIARDGRIVAFALDPARAAPRGTGLLPGRPGTRAEHQGLLNEDLVGSTAVTDPDLRDCSSGLLDDMK